MPNLKTNPVSLSVSETLPSSVCNTTPCGPETKAAFVFTGEKFLLDIGKKESADKFPGRAIVGTPTPRPEMFPINTSAGIVMPLSPI
ncbi:hypothetical protein GCM10011408_21800 [Dyella caseinilytica]|nr:hypothetical protein GCM10011408_21800 [Dyella caseinilytica]